MIPPGPVQREIYDESSVEAAPSGKDPRDDATDVGPQITREHFDRVDGFVRRAVADGAKPVLGGGPNDDLGGLYFRPTAFVGAPAGSEILREEVFGPVLTVQPFTDEDEAVSLANATDYGLAAILYTKNPERAERAAHGSGRNRLGELFLVRI